MLRNLRSTVVGAVLVSFLLAGVAFAQPSDRDDKCERRVRKAEARLDQAIRRHGEGSRQARQRREQLEQARRSCHRDRDRDHDSDRR